MRVLRKFGDIPTKPGTHSPEFMAHLENCAMVKGGIPPVTVADPLHTHKFDQFYFVMSGVVDVQLGTDKVRAEPDTLVRIPAGLAHFALNEGVDPVVQMEILLPAPVPASGGELIPIKELCTENDEPPPPNCLTQVRADKWMSMPDGKIELQILANRASGSEHGMISVTRVAPGTEPTQYGVHPFDEFYFVLDGELTVDLSGEVFTGGRHDLIVVPARTPYRAWNAGEQPERHLTVVAPEPPSSMELSSWTVPVDFARQ
ncbi:cupin domain-containing protein [Mycobacterium sp.]|uniref:cupin domain-containing protein n=1 Tax=Mycobacterium sp. TaxID=1785 RepID=UPI003D118511